jgi:hypothetical protein
MESSCQGNVRGLGSFESKRNNTLQRMQGKTFTVRSRSRFKIERSTVIL